MNFDINRIEQILKTENLYSDTLGSKSPEAMKDSLAAKVESQKWCLGIDTELKYYTDVAGALQRVMKEKNIQPSVYNDMPETHSSTGTNTFTPGTPNRAGFVMMPERGPGWISNAGSPDSQRWGVPTVIQALVRIAAEWQKRGNKLPLVYGDISLRNGGPFSPHVSHRDGVDIDIRAIGDAAGRVVYGQQNYNRAKTREFIKLIINNGVHPVAVKDGKYQIGFQDPVLVNEGLSLNWPGHKDHLHVRFAK